jgi:hypothetical protein
MTPPVSVWDFFSNSHTRLVRGAVGAKAILSL